MNLLLVDPAELAGDGTCVVRDHRALHLRSVIGVRPGWHVRAGVTRVEASGLELELSYAGQYSDASSAHAVLASGLIRF